jgi:hypothetical protein
MSVTRILFDNWKTDPTCSSTFGFDHDSTDRLCQSVQIGDLYAPVTESHVHFAIYKNHIPVCPEPHFTPAAQNQLHVLRQASVSNGVLCSGSSASFPDMLTPYRRQQDIAKIERGFSDTLASSPWGGGHPGYDIFPDSDNTQFQASCAGEVDSIEMENSMGLWQVNVVIHCDDYVIDPEEGDYFIPFDTRYVFKTNSFKMAYGQDQRNLLGIMVGDHLQAGELIGPLRKFNSGSHVEFSTVHFAKQEYASLVVPIPFCLISHFAPQTFASMQTLLQREWPHAHLCYNR